MLKYCNHRQSFHNLALAKLVFDEAGIMVDHGALINPNIGGLSLI
jgi:hypothetical protein